MCGRDPVREDGIPIMPIRKSDTNANSASENETLAAFLLIVCTRLDDFRIGAQDFQAFRAGDVLQAREGIIGMASERARRRRRERAREDRDRQRRRERAREDRDRERRRRARSNSPPVIASQVEVPREDAQCTEVSRDFDDDE